MSRLVKEDANYLYLQDFLHKIHEEYSDWQLNGNDIKYSDKVNAAEDYALYEITVNYKIHKQTGEIFYINFRG